MTPDEIEKDRAPERIWADAKFWPFVLKTDECWLWTGTVMGRGYGALTPVAGARMTGAHRFSWALHNGRWPEKSEVVMHSCDNPVCVNPDHLSAGSQSENIRQCVSRGRHKPYRAPLKSHCSNGHEYTPENTEHVLSRGLRVRRCRTCKRHNTRLLWSRKNGR